MNTDKIINTHIFPFLWMHGESHDELAREIQAIFDCGIKMFCVESRPHPQFCREQWWDDFGFVLSTAKKLNMQVWMFDDKHYPTGYANGEVEKNPSLKPKAVRAFTADFFNDGEEFKFVTNYGATDKFLTAFIYKRTDSDSGIDLESGIEITDFKDNVLSVGKGVYGYCRLVILSITTDSSIHGNYIDMLNPDSCDLMIKGIYQPHYDRFSKYFGNTFVGFFSDEPCFANGTAEQSLPHGFYETKVGQYGTAYPWRDDICELLNCDKKELSALWFDTGDKHCPEFRIRYMNVITRLYQSNFSERIGAWCREHGVLYTGHIIEDAGDHCRLGTGAGHYFRSMTGQDMSGIDVVLHQIESSCGTRSHFYCGPTVIADYDFFRYTLAKLGVSAAHLEEKKKNRAMCEIFGAYGWGETINQMKWLVDFMLVRGINYFVPHAFNPKFDDDDCPPYFYHGGKNPMYTAFCELMKYTERMSSELSVPYTVKVAVLYHAEAEWSGKQFVCMDKICKELTENQIDFEIVPSEWLNKTKANVLIVPFAEYRGNDAEKEFSMFKGRIVRADKDFSAENLLKERDYFLEKKSKDIRVLKRGEKYFIFNEGVQEIDNALITCNGQRYSFSLAAGESRLFEGDVKPIIDFNDKIILPVSCTVWVKEFDKDEYINLGEYDYTEDICKIKGYEQFAGKIKYLLTFDLKSVNDSMVLDFGNVVGGLKVSVNGKEFSELFGVPYRIPIGNCAVAGRNDLAFELSTTLALKYKDDLSRFAKIDKYALPAAIQIRFAK